MSLFEKSKRLFKTSVKSRLNPILSNYKTEGRFYNGFLRGNIGKIDSTRAKDISLLERFISQCEYKSSKPLYRWTTKEFDYPKHLAKIPCKEWTGQSFCERGFVGASQVKSKHFKLPAGYTKVLMIITANGNCRGTKFENFKRGNNYLFSPNHTFKIESVVVTKMLVEINVLMDFDENTLNG